MKNILIVAATLSEIEPLLKKLNPTVIQNQQFFTININKHQIDFLITGVGMVATSYHLTKHLANKHYELAINMGIAGSFTKDLQIGEVVEVKEDRFADLGVEDKEVFKDVFDIGLVNPNEYPYEMGIIKNKTLFSSDLKSVKAITVNKVHGYQPNIDKIIEKYHPDIETMEGAAFAYVCSLEKISCSQIRAISNYVENRDKSKWDIGKATAELCTAAYNIISKIIKM